MGVRQFRSDESGAPELVQAPGSIINLLKKVLVDGYGSTDPHGSWEYIEDSVAEKAAFRSTDANANGIWLYIDDTGTDNARAAVVGMAEVFTGFDGNDDPNGDTVWALAPDYSNDQWVVNAYDSPDPVGWLVVCDERFFYLWNATVFNAQAVSDHGWDGYWYRDEDDDAWDPETDGIDLLYQYQNACWAFGDLQASRPGDGYATVLTAHGGAESTTGGQALMGRIGAPMDSDLKWLARGADQTTKGAAALNVASPFEHAFWCDRDDSPAYPEPLSGGAIIGAAAVICDDEGGGTKFVPRGCWPGVMPFYHDTFNAPGLFTGDWPVHTEVSGSKLDGTPAEGRTALVVGFPCGAGNMQNQAVALVDITGPWRPQ